MRRRVQGEEEDEELDEDEDRLDVVGLEDTSPRPGIMCIRTKILDLSWQYVSSPSCAVPNPVSVCPCVYEVSQSGIGVSIRLLELISKISDREIASLH